jgi:hypothetical protein
MMLRTSPSASSWEKEPSFFSAAAAVSRSGTCMSRSGMGYIITSKDSSVKSLAPCNDQSYNTV